MHAGARCLFERVSAWPLPALLTWTVAWVTTGVALRSGAAPALAACVAEGIGLGAAVAVRSPARRVILALGYPVSFAVSGAVAMPPWGWLVMLALLALLYPMKVWGDAPVFPTPRGALDGLGLLVRLPPNARILDAGCGGGAALRELRSAYPSARLHGVEWSWPLRLIASVRCPYAQVKQGDLWAIDWSPYDMVYVFQRPETVRKLYDKAMLELRPGAVLVSLEFAVDDASATWVHRCDDGRIASVYRHEVC